MDVCNFFIIVTIVIIIIIWMERFIQTNTQLYLKIHKTKHLFHILKLGRRSVKHERRIAAVYCPFACCDWVTWGDAAADPLRTVCERRCSECCCMLFKCPAEFLLPAPSFRSAAPLTRAWKHNRRVSESSRGFRVQGKQLAGRRARERH